jgi:hypothetical protein
MGEHPAHIVFTLDTKEPIEIGDFVKAFSGLADEYKRHVHEVAPDLSESSHMFVRKIESGSIVADLVPIIHAIINDMDKALVVEEFVRKYGGRFRALIAGNRNDQPRTKAEFQSFSDTIQAIANDPKGSAIIEAAVFKDGKKEITAAFRFNSQQARAVRLEIESRRREMEKQEASDHDRVLMVFTRSDVNKADIGKRSGERVKIEEVSDKSLSLMYGSALAEDRIKHEIREADGNVYKKGFVVDVNVRRRDGKPVAYSVTNLYDVIDLPE